MSDSTIDDWIEGCKSTLAKAKMVKKHYPDARLDRLYGDNRVFASPSVTPDRVDFIAAGEARDKGLVYACPHVMIHEGDVTAAVYLCDKYGCIRRTLVFRLPEKLEAELAAWAAGVA